MVYYICAGEDGQKKSHEYLALAARDFVSRRKMQDLRALRRVCSSRGSRKACGSSAVCAGREAGPWAAYGEEGFAVEKRPGGKPFFRDHPDLHFSISHSGEYWMCAFSEAELGLDIQAVSEGRRYGRISRRFFHPEEQAYLEAAGCRDFFDIWAAKEAYLKYTGEGLPHGMDKESVIRGGRFAKTIGNGCLKKINFHGGYRVWLCSKEPARYELIGYPG